VLGGTAGVAVTVAMVAVVTVAVGGVGEGVEEGGAVAVLLDRTFALF
jgi:hypothetical protein